MRRDQPAGFSGTGPSRTFDQSASSSSARIIASPVWDPWPISDLSTVSVTMPLVPTRSQALGAKSAAVGDGAAARSRGRWNASTRPALVSTNSRREMLELIESLPHTSGVGSGEWYPPAAAEGTTPYSPLPLLDDFSDRQLPDPFSVQGKDRVAHRRPDRRRAGLAGAALRLARRHDVHLDPWHVGLPEHQVVIEVALLHPALVEGDLAPQRRREAVHDRALHLGFHDAGVHHRAAVHRADDAMHPWRAV